MFAWAALVWWRAAAQAPEDARENLRNAARDSGIADTVQSLTAFSALPGISAARFTIDEDLDGASDAKATKLVLPLSHTFDRQAPTDVALYTELTLGYLQLDQDLGLLAAGTPLEASVDSEFRVFSAIAGLGPSFDLGAHTTIRPIALFGYSRIEQHADFSGQGSADLKAATEGFLFDYTLDQAVFGGALEIEHRQPLPRALEFTGNVRYNHLLVDTFDATDSTLETTSNLDVVTALAELDGPIPFTLLGRDLRWIAFVASSSFPGNSSQALDFDYFFELGGGLEIIDRSLVQGIEGASLRASGILGNGIAGWNVGLTLEF